VGLRFKPGGRLHFAPASRPPIDSAQPIQLFRDPLPDSVSQRRNLVHVPAVNGNRIQYAKLDIPGRSKNPRVPRQRRSRAFHYQRKYLDLLANRQLEWTFVERQDLPVG
jgi:hypothetical protein